MRQSDPLALTQLIMLYHVVSARNRMELELPEKE